MNEPDTEGKFGLGLLKNIAVNLRATGPAAILIVWLIAIACVAIFGHGDVADHAISVLSIGGALLIGVLAGNIK